MRHLTCIVNFSFSVEFFIIIIFMDVMFQEVTMGFHFHDLLWPRPNYAA